MLGTISDRDALSNKKVCHCAPLSNKKDRSRNTPLFGIPFVVSFLNIHTRRQVHQVIYQRLFMWVGPDVLAEPPTITATERWKKPEWDAILKDVPYTLRLLPSGSYSFY
eukprot:177530_1